MAGDWIPMSEGLGERREVGILAREMKWSMRETIGTLYDFWTWAQRETPDGKLHGLIIDDVAKLTAIEADFFRAMMGENVAWLVEKAGCLLIPNFDRWMGNGAKKRLKERDKKRRQRAPGRRQSVPTLSPRGRDNSGTTAGPEKSVRERVREEKKEPTFNVGNPPDEETPEEAKAAQRAMRAFLVDQILEETKDPKSRDCYRRIVHRMHPEDVHRALSETRAARQQNEITTTAARFFMGRVIDIAEKRGVDLGFKPGAHRARAVA